MKKEIFVLITITLLMIGCSTDTPEESTKIIPEVSPVGQVVQEPVPIEPEEPIQQIIEKHFLDTCSGEECNQYFQNNPDDSQEWCDENPQPCVKLMGDSVDGSAPASPGNCGNNCDEYCAKNEQECQEWCAVNNAKNPELCGFIMMGEEQGARQGDGVWEKNELTFYVKDAEGVLTANKRKIIVETITSTKGSSSGFYGWNSALQEINKLYPDNIVPDRMVEIQTEDGADFILAVHSQKEFCCDYTGDPITGKERSDIDENFAKIRSNVDAYNIINIDEGFLEDMMRHEIGHGLGLFGHVVDRKNDLMSIVSPASTIKKGNLNDLYIKYRDRIIETDEEARGKDESVADRKVGQP